jgi:predicted CXXCH cytochrome family protein
MKNILAGIIIIILFSACNRQVLKFFLDGVDDPTDKIVSEKSDSVEVAGVTQKDFWKEDSGYVELNQSIHPDYQSKRCNKCHNASQSNNLVKNQSELCYMCHKKFWDIYPVLHGPVAAGFCTSCHTSHHSKYKSLLKLSIREICQHCHLPGDVAKNKEHEKISDILCVECHDSHGGENMYLLK